MGTYYENKEVLLTRQGWLFIGNEALRIARAECYGEVELNEYMEAFRMRVRISALQTEKLETAQDKEPILASIAAVVNKYPARSQSLSQPATP